MNQMLQPHYVKVYYNRWTVYSDRFVDGEKLPVKFDDWFAANDFAVQASACVQIFPYYPEWADLERRYFDGLIAEKEASFALLAARHEEALGALISARSAIPSGVVSDESGAVSI